MANTKWLAVLSILTIFQACSLSDHPVVHSNLGRLTSFAEVEKVVDTPGPIDVETINSADWTVQLAGLVNLKSASAKEAHLVDRPEPIHVFTHILRHPKFGTYLVDTSVSQHILDDPSGSGLSWLVRQVMPLERLLLRPS